MGRTTQNELTDALTSAMSAIADSSVQSKDATLTIEAEVVEVIDEGLGTYKVKYLGNQFNATTAHTEVTYKIGDMVYVIIPNGDFDRNKIILSPVAPSAGSYTYVSSDDEINYIPIGDNLFSKINNVSLSTWKPQEPDNQHPLNTNTGFNQLFNASLKDSRTFSFTCKIQTNIDKERRCNGNYGLVLHLPVIKNVNGVETKESYYVTMDINNIIGDPYNFEVPALQNIYFTFPDNMKLYNATPSYYYYDIDYDDYPWISPFVRDFIGKDLTKPDDIFITDIQVLPVLKIDKENMSGYYSIITASNGNSFLNGRTGDTKTLTVIPYLNGKIIKNNDFNCYWFKESNLINPTSEKYHRFGGRGWEILNEVNEKSISDGGKINYQYIVNKYTHQIEQSDIHFDTKFKCVLVKDEKIISSTIVIKNLASDASIKLFSATGSTVYSAGIGNIELELDYYEPGITDVTQSIYDVGYVWQRLDKNGEYIDDNFYKIETYNKQIEGAYHNKIYFPTSMVDEVNTIICTVYVDNPGRDEVKRQTVGTVSLQVSIDRFPNGRILVENGDRLYKYDADGNSPLVGEYDGPISSIITTIDPISIKLYKGNGNEFNSDEYAVTDITWLVPINSLIKLTPSQKSDTTSNPGYYTISGKYPVNYQLIYSIVNSYDKDKIDNTIIVRASAPESILEKMIAEAIQIRFLKDGEGGTNGSNYSAIITYKGYGYEEKDAEGIAHKLVLFYAKDTNKWYEYDTGVPGVFIPFDINRSISLDYQVYNAHITSYSNYSSKWKIFDDGYEVYIRSSGSPKPISPITVSNGGYIKLNENFDTQVGCSTVEIELWPDANPSINSSLTHIYAYYPIDCCYVAKEAYLEKFVPIVEGGFYKVIYASDGTNPQYNNSEFHITTYLDDKILKYYPYSTTVFNNLSLLYDYQDYKYRITPTKNFDNGISTSYIRTHIYTTNRDTLLELRSEIYSLTSQQQDLTRKIDYYQYLQDNLSVFTDFERQKNIYLKELETVANFYELKTELTKTAQQLTKQINIIQSLCEEYKTLEDGTIDPKITIISNNIRTRLSTLTRLNTLIAQLGVVKNAYNQIKSITSSVLELPNKIIYEGSPERSCYLTINSNIDLYNNIVNTTYSNYLIKLNDVNSEEVLARAIMNWLNDFVTSEKLDNLTKIYEGYRSECYRYSGLIKAIECRVNSASKQVDTYNYNLILDNIINPIIDSVSWYISFTNDGGYTSEINKLTEELGILTSKINLFQEIYNQQIDIGYSTAIYDYYKPVIMLYNRYEMSFLNGWDGNKLELGDGFLIAPQIGAGIKNNDNSFTGIVLGVKQIKENTTINGQVGLFGYVQGVQSLFLNARDGSASFGVKGAGQILIEPSNQKAIIKSGNFNDSNNAIYVRKFSVSGNPQLQGLYEYAYTVDYYGYPKYDYILTEDTTVISGKSYYEKTTEKAGMLIDLSTPEIKFGTGNFSVTKEGYITAKGGGSIAGWVIEDTELHTISENYSRITLSSRSGTGRIFSGTHAEISSNDIGFYLSYEGLSITGQYSERTTSGSYVTRKSRLEINTAGNPKIYSGSHDSVGSTLKGFYLGHDGLSISSGGGARIELNATGDPKIFTSYHKELGSYSSGFYLGADGMSIGSKVYIKNDGVMRLGTGAVQESGKHWTINGNGSESYIAYGTTVWAAANSEDSDSNTVYLGTNGLAIGRRFSVNDKGELKAYSGEIGGWKIGRSKISSSNIELTANGSIKHTGGNWSINQNGTAVFKNVICGKDASGNVGNATYDSSQSQPFQGNCLNHIKKLSVDAFEAKYITAGKIKADYIDAKKIVTDQLILSNLNARYAHLNVAVLEGTHRYTGSCEVRVDGDWYHGECSVEIPYVHGYDLHYVEATAR